MDYDPHRNAIFRSVSKPAIMEPYRRLHPVDPLGRGSDPVLLNPLNINPNHLFDSRPPGHSVHHTHHTPGHNPYPAPSSRAGPPTSTYSSPQRSTNASCAPFPLMSPMSSPVRHQPPTKPRMILPPGYTTNGSMMAPTHTTYTSSPATTTSSTSSPSSSPSKKRPFPMDDDVSINIPFTCDCIVGGRSCGHVEVGRRALVGHVQTVHPMVRNLDGTGSCPWRGCCYKYPAKNYRTGDHIKQHIIEPGRNTWHTRRS